MAFIFPFKTDKFTAFSDKEEIHSTKLWLAVSVSDSNYGQLITDNIKVSLEGDKVYKPIQNLSGYYCFIDSLLPGKYKLIVQSNGVKRDQFFNEEISLEIPPITDESNRYKEVKVQDVKLIPKPSYPFPANATLIRGRVSAKDSLPAKNGKAIVNATITAGYEGEQKTLGARTDQTGEFVLLVKKIRFNNGNTKKFLKNIEIDIKSVDGTLISRSTKELLNKPLLEGETGVIVIDDFPTI